MSAAFFPSWWARLLSPLLGAFLLFGLCVPQAHAEIADIPRSYLPEVATVIVVGECVKVESKESSSGSMRHTGWFHHLRLERVERDSSGSLKPGDIVVFLSWNDAWTGTGTPPTYGSGHRGLPTKGERRRVYAKGDPKAKRGSGEDARPWLNVLLPNGWQPVERRVAFVAADDEYRSEISMPLVAACLTRDAKAQTSVAFAADPTTGKPDADNREHIAGIEALRDCDVGVLFMRWREPDVQTMHALTAFLGSGTPIVGLRTSTHMLRAKPESPDQSINDEWPTRIFGQRWISHHGHESRTKVLAPLPEARSHPILRGIRGDFVVPSWLYDVEPLPKDCTVLLWGEVVSVKPEASPARQPILWVRERTPSTATPFPSGGRAARRMAFTTLGHPGDFEQVEVRRLVEQMILWAAGDETTIPDKGVKAEPERPYVAPTTR